jgi:hypothetical protein
MLLDVLARLSAPFKYYYFTCSSSTREAIKTTEPSRKATAAEDDHEMDRLILALAPRFLFGRGDRLGRPARNEIPGSGRSHH